MKKLALIGALLLSGCATDADVYRIDSARLCYALATGRTGLVNPGTIMQELRSRNEDCSAYQAMIATRQQAEANQNAAINNALKALQGPPQVTCTSNRFGNTVTTQCN